MKIRDMFEKSIDRPVKGVIKVGQDDTANVFQELDEYVVTRELNKHFRDFFRAYKNGVRAETDAMGVWISGFFGSGKSHFLKILSYLLENREVEGRHAIDFFRDGKKIEDPAVLADMALAGRISSDVILFNIDSKSVADSRVNKEAIALVFMKVFNEHLGYCGSMPFVAELERKLDEDGRFESFQQEFLRLHSMTWKASRDDFYFTQDDLVETLGNLDIMSREAALSWCERGAENYSLSIEQFARRVKAYCDKKGNDHHVLFMADEMGQYIGEDSALMLNLQTVTEDLGRICKGKAWVVVTSQEAIDTITKVKANDFSKLAGRFETRLSLSSANVDEVIRKRILQKNAVARQTLSLLYMQKEAVMKNLLTFTADGGEKKLYQDDADFAAVYPFVPYQFRLLGRSLTAIRENGAVGAHLAEGERSMLALFKESAVALEDRGEGALVPFHLFYDALHRFINHTHAIVILHAESNNNLDAFDVKLLKALFLIKYVKEMKGHPDNLTTLLISDIDEDRLALRKKIDVSLRKLLTETLIQKNGEEYTFLTNEEQDINRSIGRETCDLSEIIQDASTVIFEGIYADKKYRYGNSSRYNFPFNQIVDDRYYKGNAGYDIGVKVITPYYSTPMEDSALRMLSGRENNVILRLPADTAFLDEIRESIQIMKFLKKPSPKDNPAYETIRHAKEAEHSAKRERIRVYLEDAIKNADIFVNGDKADISPKAPDMRINEAMEKLVATRYYKLSYMKTAPGQADIEAVFKQSSQLTLAAGNSPAELNRLALDEALAYLAQKEKQHAKVTLKALMDAFSAAPCGFVAEDVQWIVAVLFKQGRILLALGTQDVSLQGTPVPNIVQYLTKKEHQDKLLLEIRAIVPEAHLNAVKNVMKQLFGVTAPGVEDVIMTEFLRLAGNRSETLKELDTEYRLQPGFPGKGDVDKLAALLVNTRIHTRAVDFFRFVFERQDEFLNLAEDVQPVLAFFEGPQKAIFAQALKYDAIYEASKTFVTDRELIDTIKAIREIIRKPAPYGEVYKLPALLQQYENRHGELMRREKEPALADIRADEMAVLNALSGKPYEKTFAQRYSERFADIRKKAEFGRSVAEVKNTRYESDALKTRCLNEIGMEDARLAQAQAAAQGAADVSATPPPPVKKIKNVSIKQMLSASELLKTEQEVDSYVETLRGRLKKELKDSDGINVIV